jgi:hypothetical protein
VRANCSGASPPPLPTANWRRSFTFSTFLGAAYTSDGPWRPQYGAVIVEMVAPFLGGIQ